MKYKIDRIEDGIAVLEDENGLMVSVDAELIQADIREGFVVVEANGFYVLDAEATDERKQTVISKRNRLLEKFSKENKQ